MVSDAVVAAIIIAVIGPLVGMYAERKLAVRRAAYPTIQLLTRVLVAADTEIRELHKRVAELEGKIYDPDRPY